jgi:hypothetical protein
MNAFSLYDDLKQRGVILGAVGERLKIDAPVGVVTEDDKTALRQYKPVLLGLLSRQAAPIEAVDDGRHFDARPSRHPGYTSLYDPIHDEWHDFPTKDCYPSIVTLANKKRYRGGVA